jgi:hypothetical protein
MSLRADEKLITTQIGSIRDEHNERTKATWQFQQLQIQGKEFGGRGTLLLFFVVPNFNARVSGNDRWGYDHSNKRQGNEKIVHFLLSRCRIRRVLLLQPACFYHWLPALRPIAFRFVKNNSRMFLLNA